MGAIGKVSWLSRCLSVASHSSSSNVSSSKGRLSTPLSGMRQSDSRSFGNGELCVSL